MSTIIPTGDKSIIRPAAGEIYVNRNKNGGENAIEFPPLPDTTRDAPIKLRATSSSGLPVAYYVDSGPAVIDGDTLKFTPVPPCSKFPIEVRVVAWQWGRAGDSPVKSADPVTVTFNITK